MDLATADLDHFFLEASDRYQPGACERTVSFEEYNRLTRLQQFLLLTAHTRDQPRRADTGEHELFAKKFCQTVWQTCRAGLAVRARAEKIGQDVPIASFSAIFALLSKGNEFAVSIPKLFDDILEDLEHSDIHKIRWFSITLRRGERDNNPKMNSMLTKEHFLAFFAAPRHGLVDRDSELNASKRLASKSRESSRRYGAQKRALTAREASSRRQQAPFITTGSGFADLAASNRSRSPEDCSKLASPRLVQSHRDHQPEFRVYTNEHITLLRDSRAKLLDCGARRHQRFLESQSYLNRYTPCKSSDRRLKRSELLDKIEMSISMIKKQVQDASLSSRRGKIHFDQLNDDMDIQICYNQSEEETSLAEVPRDAHRLAGDLHCWAADSQLRENEMLLRDRPPVEPEHSLRNTDVLTGRPNVPRLFPRTDTQAPGAEAELHRWQCLAQTGRSGEQSSRAGREIDRDEICYTKSRGDLTDRDALRDSRQFCPEATRPRELLWTVEMPIEEVDNLKLEYQTEDSQLRLAPHSEEFSETGYCFGRAAEPSAADPGSKVRADARTKDGNSGPCEQHSSHQGLDSASQPDFSTGLGLSMEKCLKAQARRGAEDFTNEFASAFNFEKKQPCEQTRAGCPQEPAPGAGALTQRIVLTERTGLVAFQTQQRQFESSAGGSGSARELDGHSAQQTCDQRRYDSSECPHGLDSNIEHAAFEDDRSCQESIQHSIREHVEWVHEQETPDVEIRSLQDARPLERYSESLDKRSRVSSKLPEQHRIEEKHIARTQNFVIGTEQLSDLEGHLQSESSNINPNSSNSERNIQLSPSQNHRLDEIDFQSKERSNCNQTPASPISSRLRTNSRGINSCHRFNKTPVSLKRVSPLNLSLVIDTADLLLLKDEEPACAEEHFPVAPSEITQLFESDYLIAPKTRVIVVPQEIVAIVHEQGSVLQSELIRTTTCSSFVRDLPPGPWTTNLQQHVEDAAEQEFHPDRTDSFSKLFNQSTKNFLNQTNQKLSFINYSEQTAKARSIEKQEAKPSEIKRALCSEFDQIIVNESARTPNSHKQIEEIYEELSSGRKSNKPKLQQLGHSIRLRIENIPQENQKLCRDSVVMNDEPTFREKNCLQSSPRKVLGELKLNSQAKIRPAEKKDESFIAGSVRTSMQKATLHLKLEENFHNLMNLRNQIQDRAFQASPEKYFSNAKHSNNGSPQKKTNRLGFSPIEQPHPTIIVHRVDCSGQDGFDEQFPTGVRSLVHSKRKLLDAELSSSKSPWMHLNETDIKEYDKENNRLNPSRLSATKQADDSYFNDMSAVKDAIRDIEKGLVDRDYLLSGFKNSSLNRTSFSKFASKDKKDRYCTLNYATVVDQHHQGYKKFSLNERIYALENNIQLDESVSQTSFVRTCVQNSCLERQERALKLAINESLLPNYHNELEDSPEKFSDLEKFGTLSSGSFEIPIDEEDPMKKNEFFVFFNFLVEIETECNKIRRMLEAHPDFSLASFLAAVFSKLRLQAADGKPLLHKKQMFKLARLLGSKSSHKKFDSFWCYKFDKAAISSQQFLDCFFNLRAVSYDEAEAASIKNYPRAVLTLLGMLVDLQVKKEIFFHKEKNHVSVMHIIDFIKRLTKEKREYLLFKDFPGSPWFAQYRADDVMPIYRRFTTTELNQRINAYNICVILS